ncbi:MAG: 4Fe-4S binding protein [Nitrososphaerota archaeon]|jgi:dissimilatory sulfite reductase (desulfoviridin) alpha/beta subunit|nr:4Fe-4S binding protein [Nitrososphaerota archaeon]
MEQKQPITVEQIKNVKDIGFIHNKGTNTFSGRVITTNGQLTTKQTKTLSEAALKFGNGTVIFTVRLNAELPGIDFNNIAAFQKFIAQSDLKTGGTGSRVRPIVTCKGTTCKYGLSDTFSIATEIHNRFYEGYYAVKLPHKFKIAIGGCPNNCVKPDLNDLGIVSVRIPKFKIENCRGCTKCGVVVTCLSQGGAFSTQHGKIAIDRSLCIGCGLCVSKCSFKILEDSEYGFRIFIGGKWGKKTRRGSPLLKVFSKSEIITVIEKAILLFVREGKVGERFGETVDRLSIKKAEEMLMSDELLQSREKILEKE